jgi:hypothetical protein
MGASYSYGVWDRFARQANSILKTVQNQPKSRSVNILFEGDGGLNFINRGALHVLTGGGG